MVLRMRTRVGPVMPASNDRGCQQGLDPSERQEQFTSQLLPAVRQEDECISKLENVTSRFNACSRGTTGCSSCPIICADLRDTDPTPLVPPSLPPASGHTQDFPHRAVLPPVVPTRRRQIVGGLADTVRSHCTAAESHLCSFIFSFYAHTNNVS